MIKITEQEIIIDESLKKKLEFIFDFCNTTPKIINGSIRKIDNTNLSYIEPHRVIINNITFLAFNYSNDIYIKNQNKIFSKKDTRDKYMNFSRDLYTHGIIDDKEMFSIKDDYDHLKDNNKDIEKDDFDISI